MSKLSPRNQPLDKAKRAIKHSNPALFSKAIEALEMEDFARDSREAFDKETMTELLRNCGTGEKEICNPLVLMKSIRILEMADTFNSDFIEKFGYYFFPLNVIDSIHLNRMRLAERKLSDLLEKVKENEAEYSPTYTIEKLGDALDSYSLMLGELEENWMFHRDDNFNLKNERRYKNPEKNHLAQLKNITSISRCEDDTSKDDDFFSNKIWESLKQVYGIDGSKKRFDELKASYLRPLVEVLIVHSKKSSTSIQYETRDDMADGLGAFFHQGKMIRVMDSDEMSEVLAHEITHFVDHVLGSHFSRTGGFFSDQFLDLHYEVKRLEDKFGINPDSVHEYFAELFRYPDNEWTRELVARGIEIIAAKGVTGEEIVAKQTPDLLKFYRKYFLPKCREYLAEEHKKFPILTESFEENFSETSSTFFDSDNEEDGASEEEIKETSAGKKFSEPHFEVEVVKPKPPVFLDLEEPDVDTKPLFPISIAAPATSTSIRIDDDAEPVAAIINSTRNDRNRS